MTVIQRAARRRGPARGPKGPFTLALPHARFRECPCPLCGRLVGAAAIATRPRRTNDYNERRLSSSVRREKRTKPVHPRNASPPNTRATKGKTSTREDSNASTPGKNGARNNGDRNARNHLQWSWRAAPSYWQREGVGDQNKKKKYRIGRKGTRKRVETKFLFLYYYYDLPFAPSNCYNLEFAGGRTLLPPNHKFRKVPTTPASRSSVSLSRVAPFADVYFHEGP